VRNRTKDELGTSAEEAAEKERQLFSSHSYKLRQLKPTMAMLGCDALALRLTNIQAEIIRKSLPKIRWQLHVRNAFDVAPKMLRYTCRKMD
jgi:hypothetical protein